MGASDMIGRKEETETLVELVNSGKPEFLALYGRRRVGKTFLIKEFFDNSFSFYATGIQKGDRRNQLRAFKESLVKYGDTIKTIPKDWFEAFSRLESLLENENVYREYKSGRKVVFLDELPWMDTAKSDFISAFDYFWNSWGSSQKDLLLIICGSATSWIINNIVKDTGGFYNRLTRQIRLMPFDLNECEQFLRANGLQLTRRQLVECYMVFGGIPYYLNYIKPQYSIAQNIQMLFFQENSPLKYEFTQLFQALYKNADIYISLIRELSKKKCGMTRAELLESKKAGEGKELTKYLDDLEQCGFIRKFTDFSTEKTGGHYQLIDPLCLFHLTFLETGKYDSWIDFLDTPAYYAWCGPAFEQVCFQHIKQIKQTLGISGIASNVRAWKSKKTTPGAQIDLLIDRKDDVVNLCEIKYSKDVFAIDAAYEKDLIRKRECFRKETKNKKALWITMITFSGLRKNEYTNEVVSTICGEDLFI